MYFINIIKASTDYKVLNGNHPLVTRGSDIEGIHICRMLKGNTYKLILLKKGEKALLGDIYLYVPKEVEI